MKYEFFDDIDRYYNLVYPYLIKDEAKNILLFSILNSLKDNPHKFGDEKPFLATISDNRDNILLVSLRTPPYNLVISYTKDLGSIKYLATQLNKNSISLPGCLGFKEGVEKFNNKWIKINHLKQKIAMNERIYQLKKVNKNLLGNDNFIVADINYESLVISWAKDFLKEALKEIQNKEIFVNYINQIYDDIKNEKIFLLIHEGEPVTMARKAGKTPNGNLINFVYTPPNLRRKGYATQSVAKLSQKLLNEGNRYCYLFTDLSNPTSNSIYKKIGYKPIIDFVQYKYFEKI
ncbi:MAG: GNAT family N-acetyltransferase [Candidatus Lokiarchaeota archaeon]|nr:GNAT family N-acetyltransferase [Candidatus Lokiarchaeota archaeon]MBD3200403.1 GNAT family N-acetyltransferase [Candidatus Lokiarchaeota archaeon]